MPQSIDIEYQIDRAPLSIAGYFDMFKRWFVTDNVALAGILLWPAQLSIELFICKLTKM